VDEFRPAISEPGAGTMDAVVLSSIPDKRNRALSGSKPKLSVSRQTEIVSKVSRSPIQLPAAWLAENFGRQEGP